jgi:hypothetical protein
MCLTRHHATNIITQESKSSTLLIPKPANRHNPEPVPSTSHLHNLFTCWSYILTFARFPHQNSVYTHCLLHPYEIPNLTLVSYILLS